MQNIFRFLGLHPQVQVHLSKNGSGTNDNVSSTSSVDCTNTDKMSDSAPSNDVSVSTSIQKKTDSNVVRVGVGVVIFNEKAEIYVGVRRNSHGSGTLALPGGHLELYETWEQCAVREVNEEMNLQLSINDMEFLHVVNDIMLQDQKHYVTIIMICQHPIEQKPVNMEPHKCDGWKSYTMDELLQLSHQQPEIFFSPLLKLIQIMPSKLSKALNVIHEC